MTFRETSNISSAPFQFLIALLPAFSLAGFGCGGGDGKDPGPGNGDDATAGPDGSQVDGGPDAGDVREEEGAGRLRAAGTIAAAHAL